MNEKGSSIILDQLYAAITANNLNLVKDLVARGADIHAYINQKTTLECAAEIGSFPIIQYLIHQGVDVNTCTSYTGRTALHAVMQGKEMEKHIKTKIIQYLIEQGADPNHEAAWCATPFALALYTQDLKLITYLIGHGADVNKVFYYVDENESRTTAIGLAVQENNATILQLLIDHGADPSRNPEGWSPLKEAYEKKEKLAQESKIMKKQIKANVAIITLLKQ